MLLAVDGWIDGGQINADSVFELLQDRLYGVRIRFYVSGTAVCIPSVAPACGRGLVAVTDTQLFARSGRRANARSSRLYLGSLSVP